MKSLVIMLLVSLVACGAEHRDARDKYNEGVAALQKQDYEAAEKAFVEARSNAGVDPELQFRSAYDMGIAFAAHSDKVKQGDQPDLEKALELAQTGASWLADAARQRKDDPAVQANLAIVRAKVQAISDELRAGEGKLETRLDKLIGDQRAILEEARQAWAAVKQAGGADPLAQQQTLTHLADRERGIVAEAGVVTDIAADEIDTIGKKAEDKRTEQEKVRVMQLKNLDLYLLDARTDIADARRKLQDLDAENGVTKAEAAMVALKRGREQLLDPITVLQTVAQEQVAVMRETMVAAASDGSFKLDQNVPPPEQMPQWLAPPAIGVRQSSLGDRMDEVRSRLQGAVDQPPPPAPDPSQPQDPKAAQQAAEQAKMLAQVKLALPDVNEASAAMARASGDLRSSKTKPALDEQRATLAALSRAIEHFADLKKLAELAYQDQTNMTKLLGPDAAKQMKADDRATETKSAFDRNVGRMSRLKELIAEEAAKLEHAEPPPADPKADPKAAEEQKKAFEEQLAQQKQMYVRAEQLRGEAEVALGNLDKALAANSDPQTPSKEAEAKLAELRKLFFNLIEHLQQLIRDQGDTKDGTAVASGQDDFGREASLPPLVDKQNQHAEIAKAITEALAAQADAAAKQKQQQPGQPDAKALSGAATEMRAAQQDMADAIRDITKARDDKQASHSLEPVTKSQGSAIEHLEAALKLLQPPQQKNNKDQQNQDKQQQQQQQDKDKDKQDQQQQQQAGGASQRAKDEDAKRQKARMGGGDQDQQQRPDTQGGGVDKDW
ncbi:MAG TPA: hypothetical protein VGM39_23300 [Kofleriaceae bacterium]|jgi:hypothetical protein